MSISSGDIRDETRKLSETGPKFGRFLEAPKFFRAGLPKVVRALLPLLASRRLDSPTSPQVIKAHTLNFKPNFKFSGLIFFWGGDPRPSLGVRYVALINLLRE